MTRSSGFAVRMHIEQPTLFLDRGRAVANIERMAERAQRGGARLRPHFKSHQSAEVGSWFRPSGVDAVTVSSVEMAHYFADHGWTDITVAFPVNLRELERIRTLARRIQLALLVDCEEPIALLVQDVKHPVRVWVKVDVGYGRAGVLWTEPDRIARLAQMIASAPNLEFAGLLTHSGHSYHAAGPSEIRQLHKEAVERLLSGREAVLRVGVSSCAISIGDTPTCSLAEDFTGVDEIRPGNFVFYDVMQYKLGTCAAGDIAVAVACPVAGKYADRSQVLIYGGAVHLSKEHLRDENGRRIYGYLTSPKGDSLGAIEHRAAVVSLSQEHGLVQVDRDLFSQIQLGDVVFVLPVHSCLTCNLFDEYRLLDGSAISRRRS